MLSGGSGIDSTYYFHNSSDNTTPVSLTLDDAANDGLAGEGDNLMSDIEDVYAQVSNPTTITGSAADNAISGSSGNDTIDPGDGNDFVYAGSGDDTINANDGYADRIQCGPGNDTANVDEFDIVSDDCETVNRTTRGQLATEDNPPTVAWTAPADNSRLSTKPPTTLAVNATDDTGISKVIPAGVSTTAGCKGTVGVVFKAGKKTISSRKANVSKARTFSRSVTFRLPRRLHPKSLKVEVRFRGNAVLTARSARSRHVRVS